MLRADLPEDHRTYASTGDQKFHGRCFTALTAMAGGAKGGEAATNKSKAVAYANYAIALGLAHILSTQTP